MPAARVDEFARLLLVDDDPPLVGDVPAGLEGVPKYSCSRTSWVSFAFESLSRSVPDLLIPVASRNTQAPVALLQWIRRKGLRVPTLLVVSGGTETGVVRNALEAADDFVVWPAGPEEWRHRLARLLRPAGADPAVVRDHLTDELGLAQLVGEDPGFLRAIRQIPVAARSGSPVLITGETGTGKELCARAIHHLGPRRSAPFIPVDCGALPDHLFENEFFGHTRGAYTDARGDQKGLVGLAQGGTLFLDEVDSLSPAAQAKLLRFLQERNYKPLGADRFTRADLSLIAATNRELETLVREKRFRQDLYFRLNVLRLHLAPLRERREDIALLARHFVESHCAQTGTPRKTLSAAALRQLALHDWPGNVRELHNVIQRAVLFSEATVIDGIDVAGSAGGSECGQESFGRARTRAIEVFERLYVEDMLRRHDGNVSRAAREAGKERRSFGRLVKKYSILRSA